MCISMGNWTKPLFLFKVRAGDPLLKLIAVDWLKADQSIDKVALRPSCVVQVIWLTRALDVKIHHG